MTEESFSAEIYKKSMLPRGSKLEPCPVCGANAEIWKYSEDFANYPIQWVIACNNSRPIGAQAEFDNPGCLLFMPPKEFYRSRAVEAVNYWNEFANALKALRSDSNKKSESEE